MIIVEERLQKIISNLGITSRRNAELWIKEGKVTVNGRVAEIGTKAIVDRDHIKISGKLVNVGPKEQKRVYIKFYKPRGVITSLSDNEGRTTVIDFLKEFKERIYPVGRLDYHSEGLLILTNDGEFANRVLHPSKKIPKTYFVKLKGAVDEEDIKKLRRGVMLEDGITAPAEVKRLKKTKTDVNSWIEMTLHEGRKRQIRRMAQKVGYQVTKIMRVSIGGVSLEPLKPGQWLPLTEWELRKIKHFHSFKGS